ncbi:MAG: UDP-N-acetylmuramoyl-tripeptide--D-alanyl-D-alanine ligase [Ruminococcus sp.]|nr:UDP-N-acetylmuramoyl-tripeptide--D-alanyl-D-alanine ligase [Ruminococcus sp.]
MEKMKLSEIVQAVDGSFGYPADTDVTSVSTDTRTIEAGSVFVALKGDNFDGHDYGAKACELGAAAVIAERPIEGARCIVVDSTHRALLQLANYYRRKFDIPLVGITGSVGKTTTKDMIALVLSKKFNTVKTEGNHNNEIGMPKTLFGIDASTGAAVIEMGMNHFGEISRLSMCCEPTCAVITNIGHSHIENLGSQEGILKAKMEILDGAARMAPLVLSMDDKLLSQIEPRHGRQIVFYSIKKKTADVYASDIKSDESGTSFTINYKGGSVPARLNCLGEHNIKNALAAFAVGTTLDIDPVLMAQAVGEFRPQGIRQNIRQVRGMTFVVDCYNAAPDSVKAALSALDQLAVPEGGRRIAVLSDMLELGKHARTLHKLTGEYVASSKADLLYCCGSDSKYYVDGAVKKGMDESSCRYFESKQDMIEALKSELHEGDAVLFKGSRGMKLEEAVDALE